MPQTFVSTDSQHTATSRPNPIKDGHKRTDSAISQGLPPDALLLSQYDAAGRPLDRRPSEEQRVMHRKNYRFWRLGFARGAVGASRMRMVCAWVLHAGGASPIPLL